jgi:hypothetical protein
MEIGTLAFAPAFAGDRSTLRRVTALVAAILLVLGMFVVVQQFDASPAGAATAPAAAVVGGDHAQINISQLICGILLSVRNAFANSPFAGFVTPILDAIIRAFGCAPS